MKDNIKNKQAIPSEERTNPFFKQPYGTPHNTAPFDQIHIEDYEPAILEGIRQELYSIWIREEDIITMRNGLIRLWNMVLQILTLSDCLIILFGMENFMILNRQWNDWSKDMVKI